MIRKRTITQLVWLVSAIAFLAVALTGDRTLYDFGYGALAGLLVMSVGHISIHLFWDDDDDE